MGRHLVARQMIEIVATNRREAELLMARTSAAAPALMAAVERVLDSFDAPGHRIRLDVVRIDLGRCSPAGWEAELLAGIERELAACLPLSAPRPEARQSAAAVRTSAALELLAEFARSGRLPWWCGPSDTPAAAIGTLLADPAAPEAVRWLLGLPGAIERFVQQLDPAELAALVVLAAALPSLNPAQDTAALMVKAAAADDGGRTTKEAWRAVLRLAATGAWIQPHPARDDRPEPGASRGEQPKPSRDGGGGRAAPGRAGTPPSRFGSVHPSTSPSRTGSAPQTKADDQPAAALATRLEMLAQRWPGAAAPLRRIATRVHGLPAPAALAALDRLEPAGVPEPAMIAAVIEILVNEGCAGKDVAAAWLTAIAAGSVTADPHDAVALDTAGLPLIWPFLPTFFDSLGLLDEQDFRDEFARHRAILLLHFLATGERTAPEPRLPLAKLLAGLDLDAVHIPGAPLTDAEAAAGETLLAAVIAQAPMLGRISVDGLRASFLLRPGTLTTRDGHWLLRIERRSFDILLERLPWPLAWARLHWMRAPLEIEW